MVMGGPPSRRRDGHAHFDVEEVRGHAQRNEGAQPHPMGAGDGTAASLAGISPSPSRPGSPRGYGGRGAAQSARGQFTVQGMPKRSTRMP